MSSLALSKLKKKIPLEKVEKPKKKIDRFDGLSEEEVQKYTLSDYLEPDLDMVFVGINPSLMAAHRGRYYAGPGNHFYKLLYESGLVPKFVSFEEDYKLLRYGIGLTNIVARATRSSADLKRTEIKEGAKIVEEKLRMYKPRVAVFNGKCIYEVFANKTGNFNFGLQPERIGATALWVIPSSSARCAHFPRMEDKLHFYTGLKKYVAFLKGEIKNVDVKEFWFDGKCKQYIPSTSKMWRRKNLSAFIHGGRVANKDTVCMDTSEENVAIAHSTEFIVTEIKAGKESEDEEAKDRTKPDKSVECSLEHTENLCDNDTSSQKQSQENLVSESRERDSTVEINNKDNREISNSVPSKLKIGNSRKRKLERPLVKIRSCTEHNGTSDFVNLIKQRLQQKGGDNINKVDETEREQFKSLNAKSKLQKFSSKDTKENVDSNDSLDN